MKAFDNEPGVLVHRGTVLVPEIVKTVLQDYRVARSRAYDEMVKVGNQAAKTCAQAYSPSPKTTQRLLEQAGGYEKYVSRAIFQQVRNEALKYL